MSKQNTSLAIVESPNVLSFTANVSQITNIVDQLVPVPVAITCQRSTAHDCIPNNKYWWGIHLRLDQSWKRNKNKLLRKIPHTLWKTANRSCRINSLRRGTWRGATAENQIVKRSTASASNKGYLVLICVNVTNALTMQAITVITKSQTGQSFQISH